MAPYWQRQMIVWRVADEFRLCIVCIGFGRCIWLRHAAAEPTERSVEAVWQFFSPVCATGCSARNSWAKVCLSSQTPIWWPRILATRQFPLWWLMSNVRVGAFFGKNWRPRQGPLATLHGRGDYSKAMQQWQRLLPERLENFEANKKRFLTSRLSGKELASFYEALLMWCIFLLKTLVVYSFLFEQMCSRDLPLCKQNQTNPSGFRVGSLATGTRSDHCPMEDLLCGPLATHPETVGSARGQLGETTWNNWKETWKSQLVPTLALVSVVVFCFFCLFLGSQKRPKDLGRICPRFLAPQCEWRLPWGCETSKDKKPNLSWLIMTYHYHDLSEFIRLIQNRILVGSPKTIQKGPSKSRAELTLDAAGRVVRHEEAIAAGFGIVDAIARYELLTARRQEATRFFFVVINCDFCCFAMDLWQFSLIFFVVKLTCFWGWSLYLVLAGLERNVPWGDKNKHFCGTTGLVATGDGVLHEQPSYNRRVGMEIQWDGASLSI